MNRRGIGIIGAGAIGGILGAHLSNAGHMVYVVDIKKEIVDAINESGLHISGLIQLDSRVAGAVTSIAQLEEFDITDIFICVKAYILPKILDDLRKFDDRNTSFVSFQNGLDLLELLATGLGKDNLFRAAVNYAGNPVKPGYMTAAFFHRPNYIGCLDGAGAGAIERAREISAFLTEAGLETEYAPDIKKRVWQKAILNSALMPTSVITGLLMNQIMELPETRKIVEDTLHECIEVALAEGYAYGDDFEDKAIGYLSTAGGHKTSMLVDFEAGSPLELDFLNGRIQEYADKHGIRCEVNKLTLSLIKGMLHHRDASKGVGPGKKK